MASRKRFDKKNAVTFSLVPRSQSDPRIMDPSAPKFVLEPTRLPASALSLADALPENFPLDTLGDYDKSANPVYSREGGVDLSGEGPRYKQSRRGVDWDNDDDDFYDEDMDEDDDMIYDDEQLIEGSEDQQGGVAPNMNSAFWTDFMQSPFEYDYGKHYRPITGLGQFVGIHGERADPLSEDPIVPAIPENDTDLDNIIATADQLREITKEGVKKSMISQLDLPVVVPGKKVRITDDFVEALEVGNTNGFLELDDDFFLQAMAGEAYDFEEDYEDYEDFENDDLFEMEEDFEHEEIDMASMKAPKTPRGTAEKKTSIRSLSMKAKRQDLDDIDYDEIHRQAAEVRAEQVRQMAEEALVPFDPSLVSQKEADQKQLDAEFAALLEEYEEFGGYGELEADMEEVMGTDDVQAYSNVIHAFSSRREKAKSLVANISQENRERTLALVRSKMQRWQEQDQSLDEVLQKIDRDFSKKTKERWDSESICSTYSNTENIPALIREVRIKSHNRSKIKITPGIDAPMSAYAKHKEERKQANAARAQARIDALGGNIPEEDEGEEEDEEEGNKENANQENDSDDEDDEDDDNLQYDLGDNLGVPRSKNESKEEKKLRKAAVKALKAQNRQNKKSSKKMYKTEELSLMNTQAKNRLLGYSVKKLH